MKKIYDICQYIKRERKTFVFFGFVFLLMVPYSIMNLRFIDEMFNLLAGRIIADGGVLYRDFFVHHTPLASYLMAIFAKIGISSVFAARILFYSIIVSFYVFVYFRYNKYFGTKTLLMFPIFFVLDIARHDLMECITYSMLQAMALLVLFLEFFVHCVNKPNKISWSSVATISLSILFAMSAAFLSVYTIAMICFGLVMLEFEHFFSEERKKTLIEKAKELVIHYMPLLLSLGIGLIIYFGYFAVNNALKEMIYQTFTFNIEIYSRYTNDVGSPLGHFANGMTGYFNWVIHLLSNLNSFKTIVPILLIVSNVCVSAFFYRKSKALGITTVLFAIYTGLRSYEHIHSEPYIIFSWFCLAYLLEHIIYPQKNNKKLFTIFSIVVLSLAPSYGKVIGHIKEFKYAFSLPSKNDFIEKYVPAGGYIFTSNAELGLYFDNNVKAATRVGMLMPWYWDAFAQAILDDLEKNKPNIIFYHPDENIWGYKINEHCKPFVDYLIKNYINLPYSDAAYDIWDHGERMWIRKGLGLNFKNIKYDKTYGNKPNGVAVGEISRDTVIKQIFTATYNNLSEIIIMFATYIRTNKCTIKLQLFDANHVLIDEKLIEASELKNNSYFRYKFQNLADSIDKQYLLVVTSSNATPGNAVTIWRTDANNYKGKLFINDQKQDDNLCIKFKYDNDISS